MTRSLSRRVIGSAGLSVLATGLAMALVPAVEAQRAARTEYEVMAAYLYNFARYVE